LRLQNLRLEVVSLQAVGPEAYKAPKLETAELEIIRLKA
jgi:hypothetical protein